MGSFKSFEKYGILKYRTAILSAVHLLVDMYCAVIFFGFISGHNAAWRAMVLYNACAFAGQAPIGAIADRLGNGMAVAACGCILLAAAWFLTSSPILCAVVMGFGNGAFHAGGGWSVLMNHGERARELGVFVSTGAIGLYCGTADAMLFAKSGLVFAGAFVSLAGLLVYLSMKESQYIGVVVKADLEPSLSVPKGGVFALACLTAVVILRAFIGSTECFSIAGMPGSAAVLCVAGGKAIGGFLTDGIGTRRTTLLSLLPCAIMVLIGTGTASGQVIRLIALLLFNMTMPITLFAAARLLKHARGFAFGLLTFGLFIGYIPKFLGADTTLIPQWAYTLMILLSFALLIIGLRLDRGRPMEETA